MPFKDESKRREYHKQYMKKYLLLPVNKEKHLARVRIHNIASRAAFRAKLAELKAGPCTDCGNSYPVVCMDFDHVRGEKLFNIGQAQHAPVDRLEAELAKCELVCANCHRIRTQSRL